MGANAETSEFRIEKARSHAMIRLANGDTVRGCFFIAGASPLTSGPERVGDVLNAEHGFFPFELHDDAGQRTVLYNRAHVVTIALADNEAHRDPGYDVATRRRVSITFANAGRIVGYVRVYRPEGRDRLSDWARQPEQFRYVETDEVNLIINVSHVIEVREVSEP